MKGIIGPIDRPVVEKADIKREDTAFNPDQEGEKDVKGREVFEPS